MNRLDWLHASHIDISVHPGDEALADGNTPAEPKYPDAIGLSLGECNTVIYGTPAEIIHVLRSAITAIEEAHQ